MPIKWENNVMGFVPQKDWLDVGLDITRPNDPIDGLLGDLKTPNLVAEWESIAAEYQIPMMAQFHGWDTEAQKTFRVPVDTHNIEKGLIKVKINQSERLRALLRNGVQGDQQIYDYVIKDGVRLSDQVATRSKVAKNELLATGQVTIKENNLDLTVDYGVPSAQTSITIDLDTDADIPAQIQSVIDMASGAGVVINGMLTSRKIIGKLRANNLIQEAIYSANGVGTLVRMSALNDYLDEEFGIKRIVTNDLTYGASYTIGPNDRPVVVSKRYYPQDKITFFATNPAGQLGVGLWGDPPEVDVARLMEVSQGDAPYVYLSQWTEHDPAVLWTKASALFMPVLYNPNSLFIATEDSDGA